MGITVITVEPADKIAFVYNCMQTRLRGQYNGKRPISLACVSRPLVTEITAIVAQTNRAVFETNHGIAFVSVIFGFLTCSKTRKSS